MLKAPSLGSFGYLKRGRTFNQQHTDMKYSKGDIVHLVPPPGFGGGFLLTHRRAVVVRGTSGVRNATVRIDDRSVYRGALVKAAPCNIRPGDPEKI